MPRYLVALSIGPIQDFIAAARRTRDLWFGSYLLSEVSKAAAYSLKEQGAVLIFPYSTHLAELAPDTPLNVANKILAELETDDPAESLARARQAAHTRWKDLAGQCLREVSRKADKFKTQIHIRKDFWDDQVDDVLESFAAWVPLGQSTDDLNTARQQVDRLLAARKNTRHFLPTLASERGYGVPKSSLDGKRETVLQDETTLPRWVKRKLGLNPGEQLDCPGLVKRLGGENDNENRHFTSIARIALDPWLRTIEQQGGYLQALHDPLEGLIGDGLVTRVKGNQRIYAALPFDAQLLYAFRLDAQREALKAESGQPTESTANPQAVLERLDTLQQAAAPFWKQYGHPSPYVAVLLADGDYMGKLLDSLTEADKLREVSQALAQFAQGVPAIVRDYRGHCIYSGGDDVLALVPLDQAMACAAALSEDFNRRMAGYAVQKPHPSLSVGIGIGHLLEPMGRLLDLARQAEKHAKGDAFAEASRRNALAILLDPRSGAPLKMRGRWSDDPPPHRRMERWIAAFQSGQLPDKAPYHLRELARELSHIDDERLLRGEMKRVLERKRADSGRQPLEADLIQALMQAVPRCDKTGLDINALVDELLIARRLSQTHFDTGNS